MRATLTVLILVAAIAFSAAKAFACSGATDTHAFFVPFFFGDGFDNTTCASTLRATGCH
ncbi:MAG TPA: hypothetical protein VFP86_21210 [bacterium]|nr:hypothetical protein [bacterium]